MDSMSHKRVSQDLLNKGFSLVELIIVIAIMGILTGGVALSVGLLRSADTKDLANQINSGLTSLKSENMAKKEPSYMHIYWYDGDYYIQVSDNDTPMKDGSGEKIGSGSVSVAFKGENDITLAPDSTDSLSFGIKKKDGAFVSKVNNTELKTTSEIEVSYSSSTYIIVLVRDTGKHYIE